MEPTTRTIGRDELLAQMGWVRALARGLVADPSLADDLAQETWLAASTRPPAGVEGPGALRAWLATVVRNLARKSGRSHTRRERREAAAARPEALESAADVVARGALHSELAGAVMQLAEPYRSAVLLRYLDGLSAIEVARRQQVSHEAARKRVSRGLALLRERLDAAHEGDRKAWVLALTAFVERGAPASLGAATTTVALPGALALILKPTLFVAVAAVALLAAWMLGPDSTQVPETVRQVETADLLAQPGAAAAATEIPAGGRADVAPAAALELELTDESGAPRAGFLALMLRGGELVARARTDAAGIARVPAQLAPDGVVLARSDFAPTLLELQAVTSPQRIVLSDGGRMSGQVELPAGAPGLALTLDCDREHPGLEGLDPGVLAAFEAEGLGPSSLSMRVEDSGPFAFGGLPAAWTGALQLEGGWTFAAPPSAGAVADGSELMLLEPVEGLELELRPPLVVTGGVLSAADRAPVVGALVWAQPIGAGPGMRSRHEARTDERGRFTVGLPCPLEGLDRWTLRVFVEVPDRGTIELARAGWGELEQGSDLGELAVDLGGKLAVQVRDAGGVPVGGAEVVLLEAGMPWPTSRITDEQGRASVRGASAGEDALLVSAPGHRPRKLEVPQAREIEVVLEHANLLEVRIVDAAGSPVEDLSVRVVAERSPFATPGTGSSDEELARRLPFDAVLGLDERGRLVLSDLEPGLPLDLSVLDGLGNEAARREVRAPAAATHVEVELVLEAQPFRLAGRTVDAAGRGLPRAQVYVEGAGQGLSGRTDADGAFALGPLLSSADALHLEASRPGFLPVVLDELAIEPQAEPLELVLERGRSLDVFLSDADGRAVQLPYLVAAFEGRAGGLSDELEPGHHRFDLLPQAAGELQAALGGVTFRLPIGANESSARFALPATGRLDVSVDTSDLPIDERTCVVLQALDREGEPDRTYFVSGPDGLLPRSFDLVIGRYRVQLESRRLGGPGGSRVTPVGKPLEVTVTAGQMLTVTLP